MKIKYFPFVIMLSFLYFCLTSKIEFARQKTRARESGLFFCPCNKQEPMSYVKVKAKYIQFWKSNNSNISTF